jgi:hypothetical protein
MAQATQYCIHIHVASPHIGTAPCVTLTKDAQLHSHMVKRGASTRRGITTTGVQVCTVAGAGGRGDDGSFMSAMLVAKLLQYHGGWVLTAQTCWANSRFSCY